MLLAVLILILAVLLFGSSAVIGFFGLILGFIAAAIGLAMLFSITGVPSNRTLALAVIGFCVALGAFHLWFGDSDKK